MENTLVLIGQYFDSEEKPMVMGEFAEFWSSLTSEERTYYKNVDLETGLPKK